METQKDARFCEPGFGGIRQKVITIVEAPRVVRWVGQDLLRWIVQGVVSVQGGASREQDLYVLGWVVGGGGCRIG